MCGHGKGSRKVFRGIKKPSKIEYLGGLFARKMTFLRQLRQALLQYAQMRQQRGQSLLQNVQP